VFHLVQPTGDFLHLLALPATAPIPKEVAGCFTKAGEYGRYLVATGPQMIEGSDEMLAGSCDALQPIPGFIPNQELTLTNNPDYDAATDSPEVRTNDLDVIHIEIGSDDGEVADEISSGDLTGTWAPVTSPETVDRYLADPELRPLLHSDVDGRTWYVGMNLLTPPFDDVHVRRAVNLVLDRTELRQRWGGAEFGQIATHVFPPTMLPSATSDPASALDEGGSDAAARAEMARSRYDRDRDGRCDRDVCGNVVMGYDAFPPLVDLIPSLVDGLSGIGVQIKVLESDRPCYWGSNDTVNNLIPISMCENSFLSGADPAQFTAPFDSSGIRCEGQINTFEMGMRLEQARECDVEDVYKDARDSLPSEDRRIARCSALSDPESSACWAEFDRILMSDDIPMAPFLWSSTITVTSTAVTGYEFDQFSGTISLCHIGVAG
jgi:ABC-type transport system substrate-binding protein